MSDSTVNSSSTSSPVTLTSTNTTSGMIILPSTTTMTSLVTSISSQGTKEDNNLTTISSSTSKAISQATTAIPTAVVPLEFKIVNKNFTEDLKNKSSEVYINFTSNIENQYSIRVEVYSDGISMAVIYQVPVNGYRSHVTYQCHVTTGRHSANVSGTAYVWELTRVYQEKFSNFKSVTVIALSQGSVIATTELEFANSTVPVPSSDNTVRALVSSLQSDNFVGDLQLKSESINSNVNQMQQDYLGGASQYRWTMTQTYCQSNPGVFFKTKKWNILKLPSANLSNLAPLDVSISFLIMIPYNQSSQNILKTQANNWVNNTLLLLPNITTSENASVTFTNNSGWTLYSVVFPIITPLLFDVDAALGNFISNRKNAEFTIVPSTLTIQGKSPTLNTISPPLRILDVPQSLDLSTKSSATFQQYSKAIEDSFKDIFGEQQVEPIVTGFTNDPLSRMVSVYLYFPSDAINKTTVINKMEANVGTFTKRNLNLDLFLLDPKVGVQVSSNLMQDYTSNLSNASSSDAIGFQNTVLDLLTPELKKFYGNSLQDPPSVSFRNSSDGLAAMDINYILNYTTNVDSSLLLTSLINNTGLINIIRISSLSVNAYTVLNGVVKIALSRHVLWRTENELQSNIAASMQPADITPVVDLFTLKPRFINQDYGADLKDRNSKRFIELANNITQGHDVWEKVEKFQGAEYFRKALYKIISTNRKKDAKKKLQEQHCWHFPEKY
ncbi:unnamed protein product [Ranitomeya imitator]|uniref:SEA domain-containing protein n=1 Tax=Ranitomeya imitator TaxID=111125 RepID=A0ABN9L7R9_9NEOB|nr:unnamed protein product [Ranitomeya imitator]